MDGDSVDIEYECRVLEIDVDSFMKLLEDNGAIKKGEYFKKGMYMILNQLIQING